MSDDERTSYRISETDEQVAGERTRLAHLTDQRDVSTCRLLEGVGVAADWRCLELGAGSGTIAQWLCERVGPGGSVLSLDVDTRFHCELPANGEVRECDATAEPLGEGAFDLVHARAFLEHLHQREAVLDAMVAALAPGGWILVEDGDWGLYGLQEIPEPFRTLSLGAMDHAVKTMGMDPYAGRWLLPALRCRGLAACDAAGTVWTLHGGTPSAEWYVGGLARAKEALVGAGVVDAATADAAIAQARAPDFAILGPVSLAAWGQKPATP